MNDQSTPMTPPVTPPSPPNRDQNMWAMFCHLAGLLGLFLFGMFTDIKIKDKLVPVVCILAPVLTYILNYWLATAFQFDFGFINIAVNALITITGLLIIKK